jgi:CHAT domain-containing protein
MWPQGTRALMLVVCLLSNGCSRDSPQPSGPAYIASAILGSNRHRPVFGRIAADVPHHPYRVHARIDALNLEPGVLQAIAAVERRVQQTGDSEAVRTLAIVALLTGRADAALQQLNALLQSRPHDGAAWNDLSVTYLELAGDPGDSRFIARALNAACRALALDPRSSAARYNRAAALERLGLQPAAATAWHEVSQTADQPEWAEEARAHEEKLRARSDDWPARLQRLTGTDAIVSDRWLLETTDRYRQESREALEDIVLPEWGRAVVRGERRRAETLLSRAAVIASRFAASGDRFLEDSLTTIQRAEPAAHVALAQAHESYGRGRTLYEQTRREEALRASESARRLLDEHHSPFRFKALLETGIVYYQTGARDQARRIFQRVIADAERRRYEALLGRAQWLLAIALMQVGALDESVDMYRRASERLAASGELGEVAAVANGAADSLRRAGEHNRGWEFLGRALRGLSYVRTARRSQTLLVNASLFADDDGLTWAALEFQNGSLQAAFERGAASTKIEALARRAHIYLSLGDPHSAQVDLQQARGLLREVPSPSLREYVEARLAGVEAEALLRKAPAQAIEYIDRSLRTFARLEPNEVPRLWLLSGRAWRAQHQPLESERSFRTGLEALERRLTLVRDEALRITYRDEAWDLFGELVSLMIADGRYAEAFGVAERGRQRGDATTLNADIPGLQRALPPGALALYYLVLPDRLVMWAISAGSSRVYERVTTRDDLEKLVDGYTAAIRNGDERRMRASGRTLTELLLPPEATAESTRTIAIVPDGVLFKMPFATLPLPAGALIESAVVLTATNAGHLIARRREKMAVERALLVPGQASDPERFLAEVQQEVRDVAQLYPAATVLQPADRQSLIRALGTHSIFHFAGHAIANERFPSRSYLLLNESDKGSDNVASLDALSRASLEHLNLVVLSACDTASGPITRGEGTLSLARPFLAARVSAVIAALWPVDDRAARLLLVRFHAAYKRTSNAPAALREAQLALVQSGDPGLMRPTAWAAFVAMAGSGIVTSPH